MQLTDLDQQFLIVTYHHILAQIINVKENVQSLGHMLDALDPGNS